MIKFRTTYVTLFNSLMLPTLDSNAEFSIATRGNNDENHSHRALQAPMTNDATELWSLTSRCSEVLLSDVAYHLSLRCSLLTFYSAAFL